MIGYLLAVDFLCGDILPGQGGRISSHRDFYLLSVPELRCLDFHSMVFVDLERYVELLSARFAFWDIFQANFA